MASTRGCDHAAGFGSGRAARNFCAAAWPLSKSRCSAVSVSRQLTTTPIAPCTGRSRVVDGLPESFTPQVGQRGCALVQCDVQCDTSAYGDARQPGRLAPVGSGWPGWWHRPSVQRSGSDGALVGPEGAGGQPGADQSASRLASTAQLSGL